MSTFKMGRARMTLANGRVYIPAMDDETIDSVVTDPPYHLTTGKKGGTGPATVNLNSPAGRSRVTTGFMGKEWDGGDIAFDPAFWRECLRVMKPGAYLLAFGGTRTSHRMVSAIEDAGFEIQDSIAWIYGSGFPKSVNLSEVREGWGTALKPAFEPICMARKPRRTTVKRTMESYGTGGINIDGCRIDLNGGYKSKPNGRPSLTGLGDNYDPALANQPDTIGRWPANVAMDAQAGAMLDLQSGNVLGAVSNGKKAGTGYDGGYREQEQRASYGDQGGASRFFYCPKVSDRERAGALHPTIKPLALMRWLTRLVTPPGGLVFDPFAGSGSTLIASELEGFRSLGIDKESDHYFEAVERMRTLLPHLIED